MAEKDAENVAGEQTTPDETQPGEPAAEKPEEHPTVTTVEDAGPCARLIKVEVPQARVAAEIEKSYDELRKTVFIKGFRKGHIPRPLLVSRFGEDVLESVKQSLVDESLEKAEEKHSLRLAMPPQIDPKTIPLDAAKPLTFEVKVEVVPEFTLDNYKGLAVERPAMHVADADIAQALESFRARHAKFEKLDQGTVQEGDVPIVHAIALQNGQEIWRENELGAFLNTNTLAGIAIPELKDAMVGASIGDTKSFKAKLPDNFRAEEHRGKEVDLEVTIDEMRRLVLPEATDEWAKSLRFDDLDDLRDELRDELRRHRAQEADDAVHDRIAEKLLELTGFDVPEGFVQRIVERARDRQRMALLYRGTPREEIDKAVEGTDKQTRESSLRQCKLFFIYEKIADAEKLFTTEEEVQQRIQAIALNYRRRPEDVASELEREGRLSSLRQEMREEKVRDFLVQHAVVAQAEAPAAAEPAKDASA